MTMLMILQVPEIHGIFRELQNCSLFQDSAPLRHVISYVVISLFVCLSLLSLDRQQNTKLVPVR